MRRTSLSIVDSSKPPHRRSVRVAVATSILALSSTAGCDPTSRQPARDSSHPTSATGFAPHRSSATGSATGSAAAGDTTSPFRSSRPSEASPQVLSRLGVEVANDLELHALQAWITSSPPAPHEPALLALRDDDLSTAWALEGPQSEFTLVFPGSVSLQLVAVTYSATNRPRPERVRLHTERGFVDASLPRHGSTAYILLDEPLATTWLTLSFPLPVLPYDSPHPGLAEVEVFGGTGPPRPPWAIDPTRVYFSHGEAPWQVHDDGTHHLRASWLTVAGAGGPTKRLLAATAVFGSPGDRWLLLEHLRSSSCELHDVQYSLLDPQTRRHVWLGDLGPGGPFAWVGSLSGEGFAVHEPGLDLPSSHPWIELRGEKILLHRSPAGDTRRETISWDVVPFPRGGSRPDDPTSPCRPGTDHPDLLEASQVVEHHGGIDPEFWAVCRLERGHHAVVGTGSACGRRSSIVVLDAEANIVARRDDEDARGRGVRIADLGSAGLWVEVERDLGATSDVFRVTPTGISMAARHASLAIRVPPGCQDCEDRFWVPEAE